MVLSIFDFWFFVHGVASAIRSQLRWAQLALVLLTLVLGVLSVSTHVEETAPFIPASSPKVQPTAQPVTAVSTSPPASSKPGSSKMRAQVVVPQDCTPGTAFSVPSGLNLADKAAGLTQVIEAPSYYQVYGNTSTQIHTQLQKCTPTTNKAFTAEAGYNLTWMYSVNPIGSGLCSLSNVKIGLHTNMVLPQWTPTSAATAGLADSWYKLMGTLRTHENGHVSIDQQYAAQLLNDLQNLSATDCASISAQAQAKTTHALVELGEANSEYDVHTSHGTTQGAAL